MDNLPLIGIPACLMADEGFGFHRVGDKYVMEELLKRDLSRMADALSRGDECPLGSAALAGTDEAPGPFAAAPERPGVAEQNLQARLRGMVLMAVTNMQADLNAGIRNPCSGNGGRTSTWRGRLRGLHIYSDPFG